MAFNGIYEDDEEQKKPEDSSYVSDVGKALKSVGKGLAYIPTEFVKGGIEAGKRFVEGGQMVGALPGSPGWVDKEESKPAPPAATKAPRDPSADPFPPSKGDDETTARLKKNATEYYNQSTQPAEALPTVKLASARKKLGAKYGVRGSITPDAPAAVQEPSQPRQDPMAGLDAMNMRDRADLATAQAASRKNADAALAHSYAEQALHSGTGVAIDENSIKLKNAEIGRPLDELAQRRQVEQENLKTFQTKYDLQQDMRQDDPADPMARQAAALLVSQKIIPPSAAGSVTLRAYKYYKDTGDWQQAQAKAAEEKRWHNMESADKRRGQDMQLMEAQIRADRAGAPKSLRMDKAADKNLQTHDTLEGLVRRMPQGFDPRNMYTWQNQMNDIGATMVGAGRLNQVLMQNIKNFSPEWWNTPGRAKELQGKLLDLIRESRESILDQQEAAGVDPQVIAQHRALYARKYPGGMTGSGEGKAGQRAGWEHMPDGSRFPVDAQGNRLGPAVK